jgi:tRNA A-37 threonylcarbamoyl transferase component Bud32
MPIASVAALLRLLDEYGLVDPEQQPHLAKLAQTGPGDPRAFARELVQRGLLTPYQINQLFRDNGASLLLGSYVVLERLGSGGMSNVLKARHQKLGRIVALKIIHRDKLNNPAVVKRFLREIRVAAQLDHPHIVHAYDAEEANGAKVLVMEYLEGADLGKMVKETGPLSVRDSCDYVRQAALGLQHAYEKGLVHRDIKPSNLMLQTAGSQFGGSATIKLLDLGLALLQQPLVDGSVSGPLTVAGKVVGTVDFLAPEQARDASSVDIRADLYGLGCTFYFLLTGQTPFDGATVTNKLFKHALEEPEPVERLRPEVPPAMSAVIRKLMAKRPDDRYQTPAELAVALEEVLSGRPAKTVPAARDGVKKAAPAALVAVTEPRKAATNALAVPIVALPVRKPRAPDRRWLWLCSIGLSVLLVMAGVLIYVVSHLGPLDSGIAREESHQSPAEREAQAKLDRLLQRHQDGNADKKQLREELVAFRWRYPGLPPTQQALALLRDLPSPLDDLDPANIPERPREGHPPELVAILRGTTAVLQVAPEGPRVLRTSGMAVAYDDLVTGVTVRPFSRAGGVVGVIGLSLDGKHALLGGKNKYLGLWDVTTGREVRKLDGHPGEVKAAALSSDARWGLSGDDNKVVYLWNLGDGTKYALDGHTAAVTGTAFTPDGKLALTAGADKALRLWDLELRRERKPVVEAKEPLTCLALAPDGKRAYSGSARGVQRWSLTPLGAGGVLDGYAGPVSSLALTADGRYLAASHPNGFVGVWDLASGQKVKEWNLAVPAPLGVSWAIDGRHLVVAGGSHGVYVLRLPLSA